VQPGHAKAERPLMENADTVIELQGLIDQRPHLRWAQVILLAATTLSE